MTSGHCGNSATVSASLVLLSPVVGSRWQAFQERTLRPTSACACQLLPVRQERRATAGAAGIAAGANAGGAAGGDATRRTLRVRVGSFFCRCSSCAPCSVTSYTAARTVTRAAASPQRNASSRARCTGSSYGLYAPPRKTSHAAGVAIGRRGADLRGDLRLFSARMSAVKSRRKDCEAISGSPPRRRGSLARRNS